MEFSKFIEWAFMAVLSGGVLWAAKYLQSMSRSMAKLHQQIATIVERTAWHEKTITDHAQRIRHLESKKRL